MEEKVPFQEFQQDPLKEKRVQQTANAFADLADQLMDPEELAKQAELKAQENMSQVPPRREPRPEPRPASPKETVRSMVQGPKYMDALQHVLEVADIRSIETELPILRTKAEIKPLTGEEEIALRSAAVSPETFLKKLDEILFKHTTFSNFEFASYQEFLSNLFPPDKSMLIWALMTASYLVLPTLEKECESCKQNYLIDANPADMLHQDSLPKVWDKELPPSEYREIQPVLDGYMIFELGMPSEKDRLVITKLVNPAEAKENLERTGGLLSYADNLSFFVKTIVVGDGPDRIVLTDVIQDIHPFLKQLPPKIADAVRNEVDVSVFDEYLPRFYLKTTCTHCGHKEEIDLDPEIAFFRKTVLV